MNNTLIKIAEKHRWLVLEVGTASWSSLILRTPEQAAELLKNDRLAVKIIYQPGKAVQNETKT